MSKLGRNEPCHCGSGKKYKKCCLGIKLEPVVQDFSETLTNPDIDDAWDDFEDDTEEKNYPQHNKYPCKKFIENIPQIDPVQKKLVDDWWDVFEKPYKNGRTNVNKCIVLLKEFLTKHPELAPNLEIHYEALFEIGAEALRTGQYDTYIEFLIWYRKNCIEGYKLSGAYYDRALIEYFLIQKDCPEKIIDYFDIYKEYPDHGIDELAKVKDSLQGLNQPELCIELLNDIYPNIFYSHNVIGSSDFVEPIVLNCFYKYAKRNYSEKDLDLMINELKEISSKVPEMGIITDKEFWDKRLNNMYSQDSKLAIPSTSDIKDFYEKLTLQFEVYLNEKKNKKWLTASYLSSHVLNFLLASIKNKKKKSQNVFNFDSKKLERFIMERYKNIFWLEAVPSLSFIQAIYYFCEFLKEKEYINEIDFMSAKKSTVSIFSEVYKHSKNEFYTTKYFENFPIC